MEMWAKLPISWSSVKAEQGWLAGGLKGVVMGVISVGRLDTYGKILNSRVQYSIGLWPVISDNAKNGLMGWGCKRRVVEREEAKRKEKDEDGWKCKPIQWRTEKGRDGEDMRIDRSESSEISSRACSREGKRWISDNAKEGVIG
ncbi:hypothetical protein PSHT_02193 [Puccinia striiformis]|uniref:Uncharacterized protein n=2 Tax=Puccinia striiformis TaxID=27350 RepID=A0A2S4WJ17_9BASI|nr:hypothetical protein PSHT_02193 [Puccinia striiformis]